ncbi:MAG: sugar phosphate isomerase/epimerase [Rubricoccaceae bacterium]
MNRRSFLRTSGTALAATTFASSTAMNALAAARSAGVPDTLGIQLYSLRDIFPGDVIGTLDMLTRFGYGEVEFAGLHDRTPAVMRGALDTLGLVAPATHVGLDAILADEDATFEMCRTMGHEYLVVPWLAPEDRPDRDGYLELADRLNALGERSKAAGVQLGYHNHDFEFDTFGGDTPAYDDFVARTDPELVVMELDLYWITKAGYDPLTYFERFPGRFPLWHVKDGAGSELAQTHVGAGQIDFARLFAASATAGLKHAFIEHDNPEDSLAFARESIEYVESLR